MSQDYSIVHGEVVDTLQSWDLTDYYDACLCDPPYLLEFMGKAFDKQHKSMAGDNDGQRMYQWHLRWCREVYKVLKPGGFVLAFGGTRTSHRLACALEDVGFEIRDTIEWMYGSGFPKSLDISKAIDKMNGDEREVVGVRQYGDGHVQRSSDDKLAPPIGTFKRTQDDRLESVAGSEQSTLWSGYGTALKPSHEPLIWARKPLTMVPIHDLLSETTHILGGLLCQTFNVNSASESFTSSLPELQEVSASVAQIVALCHGLKSGASLEEMGMCSSQETASVCLNIAVSWSGILDVAFLRQNMFTTKTETVLTTTCQILRSLISATTPEDIIKAVSLLVGLRSNASTAEQSLNGEMESMRDTRNATVLALATWRQNVSGMSVKSVENSLPQTIQSVFSVLQTAITSIDREDLVDYPPAHEPIILAMKPCQGTFAENALEYGVAGLNIEASRIPGGMDDTPESWASKGSGGKDSAHLGQKNQAMRDAYARGDIPLPSGRWPANLILSHTPYCQEIGTRQVRSGDSKAESSTESKVKGGIGGKISRHYADENGLETITAWDCHPLCPVKLLDEQSGYLKSRTNKGQSISVNRSNKAYSTQTDHPCGEEYNYDSGGGASRFFYCAKVSTSERNVGLDGIETVLVHSSTWDDEDHLVARLSMDTDTSPPRVIGVYMSQMTDVTAWNMFLFGRDTTDLCLWGLRSTISTKTSSTTGSRTLSFLHTWITNGLTLNTTDGMNTESGKNSAQTVKSGNPQQLSIGISTEAVGLIATADRAGFVEWLKQSKSVRLDFVGRGNLHPTQKPIDLCRYLATLLLPPPRPDDTRKLLIPFSGAGSEVAGSLLAGWDDVAGIEQDTEYVQWSEARVQAVLRGELQDKKPSRPSRPRQTTTTDVDTNALANLFTTE